MSIRRTYHDLPAEKSSEIYKALDYFDFSEILEFQTQKHVADECATFTLPFWMFSSSNSSRDHHNQCEVSHLLLDNQHCYNQKSPRFQSTADGRKVLMELIQNMPESCFELSLRDIVNDYEQAVGIVQDQNVMIEGKSIYDPQIKIPSRKKLISRSSRGHVSRSESISGGVFQLKMFIPITLGFRIRSTRKRKCSKIISLPSFDGFEKEVAKQVLDKREKKKSKIITQRKNSISRSKIRTAKRIFLGCWRFFSKRKSNKRQKGNANPNTSL